MCMRLFVDMENKKLVQSLTSDRLAVSPSFMQGDNEPLEIHLLATGTSTLYEDKVLNPAHDFLRVGIARFKGEPKLLTIGSFYTPLENGGCVLTLPLNTLEIVKYIFFRRFRTIFGSATLKNKITYGIMAYIFRFCGIKKCFLPIVILIFIPI